MWGRSIVNTRKAAALKPQTRAMVAYVVGELIARRGFSAIYDYSSGQSYKFKARFGEYDVDVTELGSRTQMAGGAFGKHFSLTHYGDDAQIDLNVAGKGFDGEHSKGPSFKGTLKDNLLTFIEGDNQYVFGLL